MKNQKEKKKKETNQKIHKMKHNKQIQDQKKLAKKQRTTTRQRRGQTNRRTRWRHRRIRNRITETNATTNNTEHE